MIYIVVSAVLAVFLGVFFHKQTVEGRGTVKEAPDVLLILGCRVRGEKPEPTLQMRIDKAAEYLLENRKTVAIACGGIVHDDQDISEARVICDMLTEKGVEKERLIMEDKSLTTVQNFINAKKIMEDMGFDEGATVGILSSDFHLMRASVIAQRCSFEAETLAAPSPKNEKIKNCIRELFAFPMAYTQTKGVK